MLRRHYVHPRHIIPLCGAALGVLVVCYVAQFYLPRSVQFSFTKLNCFTSPVLLPQLTDPRPSPGYEAVLSKDVSIAGYPIYSHTTCVKATRAPENNTAETIQLRELGSTIFKKTITVVPASIPSVASMAIFDKPLPATEPLNIPLDNTDLVHEYRIAANDKTAVCIKNESLLVCDIATLGLLQSTKYQLKLERLFKGAAASTVFTKEITTIEPIRVALASVAVDQTIQNIPTEITITFDKPIKSFDGVSLELVAGEAREKVATTTSSDDKTITVHLTEPLARSNSFALTIAQVSSPDGSTLSTPLVLPFKTSGGPKVQSVNIGTYKVSQSVAPVLTFDAMLDPAQPVNEFIRIEVNGAVVAATLTKKGATITIKPQAALPRCTNFTVHVLNGLRNESGITGGGAWQYKSRTICQTVFSIGSSVQGRAITAYRFGSGATKIIYTGAIHGNEKSATSLLNSWIDALESGHDRIPANRTIIVIPTVNPDGYALNQRTNTNNVDLNRNFPANDWKSAVTMPDQSFNQSGGGSTGLSEPETSALGNYILSQDPQLIVSFHASGAVVTPNDAGGSQAIAIAYAQKSTVGYLSNSSSSSFFAYDTTGALETWLHDKYNIPAILIELTTKTGNEFSGHQNALWYTAQLP